MALNLSGIDAKGIQAIQGQSALQNIINSPQIIRNIRQQRAQQEMAQKLQAQQLARGAAQTQLYQAQAQKALQPEKLDIHDPLALHRLYIQIAKINSNDSRLPIIKQMFNNASASKKGISVTSSPQGGTQVQIGGQQSPASQMPGQRVPVPGTASRGMRGVTMVDPETGQKFTSPTTTMVGNLQQAIMGESRAKAEMSQLTKTLDKMKSTGIPYFSPKTQLEGKVPFGKYIFPKAADASSYIKSIDDSVTRIGEGISAAQFAPKVEKIFQKQLKMARPDPFKETRASFDKKMNILKNVLDKVREINENALANQVQVAKGKAMPKMTFRPAKGPEEQFTYGKQVPVKTVPQKSSPAMSEDKRSWMADAKKRKANSSFSNAQLGAYYDKKYGDTK